VRFSCFGELAKLFAEEKVTDVIVTVPPFYTQAKRDAVMDAIKIVGLRTLALINNGTAVAINYAMTSTFLEPGVHMIYNALDSSRQKVLAKMGLGVVLSPRWMGWGMLVHVGHNSWAADTCVRCLHPGTVARC
jgi:hypothetical protein